MRIDIGLTGFEQDHDELKRRIESRVLFAMTRYSSLIEQVVVRVIRSTSGNTESQVICELKNRLAGRQNPITASATIREPMSAVTACIDRCRRTIQRQLALSAIREGRTVSAPALMHYSRHGI